MLDNVNFFLIPQQYSDKIFKVSRGKLSLIDIKFSVHTPFWNNHHHVHSKSKDWKAK